MFRNTFQNGFLSLFHSIGQNPLAIWDCQTRDGLIRRITDEDINSTVFELTGLNASITFMSTPIQPVKSLAIKLPFCVFVIKNLHRYFTFEIQIRDDENQLRRFRASNFQKATQISPFCVQMPLCLSPGWNQILFNLADFTRRAYKTNYVETVRVQIHANIRVRRIYFTDRLYEEHELPAEYRLNLVQKTNECGRIPREPCLVLPEKRSCAKNLKVPPTTPDNCSIAAGEIDNNVFNF